MVKNNQQDGDSELTRRLDAMIRMFIEVAKRLDKDFRDGDAVRALYSAGLSPTEIAKIAGLKSRTDITYALYANKSKKSTTKKRVKK